MKLICSARFLLLFFSVVNVFGNQDDVKESEISGGKTERDKKTISLFNVVSFPNNKCTSTDPTKPHGTCLSAEECMTMGGMASGNCAAGFGVCCIFSVSACDSMITKNLTYIQNPGFPSPYTVTAAQICTYKIKKLNGKDTCLIKLDFDKFTTSIPANGVCGGDNTDKVTIVTTSGKNPPGPGGLCGSNLNGQHIYMDAKHDNPEMLMFSLGSTPINNRMWNVKVTYIDCDSKHKPPSGCTQYFTGASGMFMSYNFGGGKLTSGQLTSYCFRQEDGYCKIMYTVAADGSFSLQDDQTKSQKNEDGSCDKAGLIVNSMTPPEGLGILCGGKLSSGSQQTMNSAVIDMTVPFMTTLRTTNDFANMMEKGFSLKYTQVPC